MKRKIFIFLSFFLFYTINAFSQIRSFDEIFSNTNKEIRDAAFNTSGYVKSSQKQNGFILLGDSKTSGIASVITSAVMNRNPGYVVELISVVSKKNDDVSLLDVYNALGNIRGLKGRLYNSHSRKEAVPLFEDAVRIKSEKQTSEIPDPPLAKILPQKETIYIKLKDVNFGNTYYRGEMKLIQNGLCYSMTNFKNMTYYFFTVIQEEKFIAQLYFEPIAEGILIYSIAGADISDFVSSKIHMSSAIAKRLEVITSWAADGISGKK